MTASVYSLAYIGPGPGLVVQGPGLLILVGFLAALFALATLPFRLVWKRRKKRGPALCRRMVVVGLDGLEPERVERLMKQEKLPHLKALADHGSYSRLATTSPPLSPVAWSTFSTGVNPGKHGIFDFVERTRDYAPILSSCSVKRVRVGLGPFKLPWFVEQPAFTRKSTSFWKILAEHGVFSQILRVPVTWPPERFDGLLLSAMGAPDLLGTQGTYTLFSIHHESPLQHGNLVRLQSHGPQLHGQVGGPRGLSLSLSFRDDILTLNGTSHTLRKDAFTPWLELRFPGLKALAKFLQLGDGRYYMTAMQVHPAYPSTPLSTPGVLSTALARVLGPFATCGLAEDLGACDDGVLTPEAFTLQCREIHQEREAQFFHCLSRLKAGICAVVFDGPDRMQHMIHSEEELDSLYQSLDELIGRTRALLKHDEFLMVLSDHGFKPLKRLFDLNAWLKREGYLQEAEGEIDWAGTRAYTLGLSGLSLNLMGRERDGLVKEGDRLALLAEIKEKLLQLRDHGESVFLSVKTKEECYQGPYLENAPDLILGFKPGYGINKEAARGQVGDCVFLDNDRPWVADHCFHPESVPGVLFSSIPLKDGPRLEDLAPTILQAFGVGEAGFHDGSSLLIPVKSLE